jgi:hypothetical protein
MSFQEQRPSGLSMVPTDVLACCPASVRMELQKMNGIEVQSFIEEFYRRKKNVAEAYLFWLLLGWHYPYLRDWGVAVLYWITGAGCGIWGFIDLFRIPSMVTNYNANVAISVLRDIRAMQS